MWALVGYNPSLPYACRSCRHLQAIGRLKTGVSIDTARRDIDAVQAQLRQEHPAEYPPVAMAIVPLNDELTGNLRAALLVLMGAVAFVLLIACANVATLLLARMAERQRDLVRQLLVESASVALAGGAIGIMLAWWGVPLLTRLTPTTISRLDDARVDVRVLGFSLLISVGTAVLFGVIPSLRTSRLDLATVLSGDGRKTARDSTSLARRCLVGADVALAVVLLAGAGLMIKSVGRLLDVNPGFDSSRVLTMQISLVGQRYTEDAAVVARVDEMLARIRSLPDVEAVAAAGQIPLGGNEDSWGFHIEGRPVTPQDPSVERYSITPDYFAVMCIPVSP
jgi:putative ABC transport system permease protein